MAGGAAGIGLIFASFFYISYLYGSILGELFTLLKGVVYMNRRLLLTLIILACCTVLADGVHALTIYRIGGSDLPPPERDTPFNFVQLEWADIDPLQHGNAQLAEVGALLKPQQLDPTVNMTPLLEERGGAIETLRSIVGWTPVPPRDAPMFDGDPATHFLGDGDWGGDYGAIENKVLTFDLGGLFNVDRIRFYPREKHLADRFIQTFVIGTNDGDPLKDGTRSYKVGRDWVRRPANDDTDWDLVYRITENARSDIELDMSGQPIRNIMFEAPANTRGVWEIAEVEIYGFGFAPRATYVTNVIDLGQPVSLGQISWSAETAEGASIELTMRSGDDANPNTYWRKTFRGDEISRLDEDGEPLVLATYQKLNQGVRAGITPDTENWQTWSPPYDLSLGGGDLVGNKPRQFVQFSVDFLSAAAAGGQLHYLEFEVSDPPVASQALAEIFPAQAPAGEVTQFTYKVLPQLSGTDLGFDSIEIETDRKSVV